MDTPVKTLHDQSVELLVKFLTTNGFIFTEPEHLHGNFNFHYGAGSIYIDSNGELSVGNMGDRRIKTFKVKNGKLPEEALLQKLELIKKEYGTSAERRHVEKIKQQEVREARARLEAEFPVLQHKEGSTFPFSLGYNDLRLEAAYNKNAVFSEAELRILIPRLQQLVAEVRSETPAAEENDVTKVTKLCVAPGFHHELQIGEFANKPVVAISATKIDQKVHVRIGLIKTEEVSIIIEHNKGEK